MRRGPARTFAVVVATLLVGAAVLAVRKIRTRPARPPHVVLYLLDAARADYFSCYGQPSLTTPQLDEFAARGTRFARHYGNASFTRASLPQLFTARYEAFPILRFVPEERWPWWMRDETVAEDVAFLPEVLAGAGYRTVLVSAHPYITPDSDLARRFQSRELLEPRAGAPYARAEDVLAAVRRVVVEHVQRSPSQPLFLYVHLMDTHTPHDASPPYDRFFEGAAAALAHPDRLRRIPAVSETRYDALPEEGVQILRQAAKGAFAYLDDHLGPFVTRLPGLLQGTPVVQAITADHGDAYGEGGFVGHTSPVFGMDEVHHIPWILHGEGLVPAGQVRDEWTSTVDVMPTLLALAGVTPGPRVVLDGRSRAAPGPRDPGVVLAFRVRARASLVGYRSEAGTLLVDLEDRVHAYAGAGEFREVGRLGDGRAALPSALTAAVRELRARDTRRRFAASASPLDVTANEWSVACRGDCGDWNLPRSFRTPLSSLYCDARRQACPVASLTFAIPAGRYRVQALVEVGPFLPPRDGQNVGGPEHGTVELDLPGQDAALPIKTGFAGYAEVGTFDNDGGLPATVDVSLVGPATLRFHGLRLEPLDRPAQAVHPPSPTDPETLERLKALGYVN